MHFCAKNALYQHLSAAEGAFGKPFMVQMGPFWPLFAVLWLQKLQKTVGQTPQNQPTMRQNHPKMGFGGILDRLEAISIPSIPISKGIKNKNFDRFWTTRCRPLSPDWLATCPIRGLATCLPPSKGETTPPPFGAKLPPFWGEIAILGRKYSPPLLG